MSSTEALRPGDVIAGRFRLLHTHGDNGWGVVWTAAPQKGADGFEVVFLEELRPEVSAIDALARLGELRAIEHRGLAKIVEVTEHGGIPTVIYRGTEGVTLSAWLSERSAGGMSAKLAAMRDVFDQMAQALGAAHRIQGREPWAHGSLGVPCVRVERRGRAVSIVRIDGFGLTRAVRAPAWWAPPPEGAAPSPHADVYALGQMIVTLTAGAPPVWEPAPLRAWWERRSPELDASLVSATLRLLDPDPSRRPHDGRQLRDVLRDASWKAVERPPPPPPPPPPRELPRAPPLPAPPPRAAVVEVIMRAPTRLSLRAAPVVFEDPDESTSVDAQPRHFEVFRAPAHPPVDESTEPRSASFTPEDIDATSPEAPRPIDDAVATTMPEPQRDAEDAEVTLPLSEFASGARRVDPEEESTNIPVGVVPRPLPRVRIEAVAPVAPAAPIAPTLRITPVAPRVVHPATAHEIARVDVIEETAPMNMRPFRPGATPGARRWSDRERWYVALVVLAALIGLALAWWLSTRVTL